ncbi:MAG: hypothetical protein MJ195_01455 [Mycoplasmoidaceae bacterium]|nr:hypothetical protein [Mycoplasmoidaceae bacterium]
MKLLKTITPIITLTGLATVVAPLTSCNGSGDNQKKYYDVLNGEQYTPKLTALDSDYFPSSMSHIAADFLYGRDVELLALKDKTDLIEDEFLFTYSTLFKQEIDTLNQFAEFTKYEIRCQYDVVNREFKIDANIAGTATDTYITSSGLKIKSIDANIQFSAKNAFNFYFAHVAGAAIKGPSGSAMENNYVMGFNLSKDGSQSLQDQQINIVVNGTITTPENETLIGT